MSLDHNELIHRCQTTAWCGIFVKWVQIIARHPCSANIQLCTGRIGQPGFLISLAKTGQPWLLVRSAETTMDSWAPCLKTIFPWYGDSHVTDKTVARPSYLQHEDPYTGKTISLYWDGPWSGQQKSSSKHCSNISNKPDILRLILTLQKHPTGHR